MMFSGDIRNLAAVKCRTTNTNIRWGMITFPEHLLNASRQTQKWCSRTEHPFKVSFINNPSNLKLLQSNGAPLVAGIEASFFSSLHRQVPVAYK